MNSKSNTNISKLNRIIDALPHFIWNCSEVMIAIFALKALLDGNIPLFITLKFITFGSAATHLKYFSKQIDKTVDK